MGTFGERGPTFVVTLPVSQPRIKDMAAMCTEEEKPSLPLKVDKSPEPPTDTLDRQQNGIRSQAADNSGESELSDPDSNILNNEPEEDEIVVRGRRRTMLRDSADNDDEQQAQDESEGSHAHYPKRKRTSIFNDLSESKLENGQTPPEDETGSPASAGRPNRQGYGGPGVKGVLLGHWRDSNVPQNSKKHAVIGFIDVRDRLRTRIQPNTKEGELLLEQYPLPPGPGGSWVTFERVVFSDHLVGLDHFQIKEYTRLRSDAPFEETVEERVAGEGAAVSEAKRRVRENPALDNPVQSPAIAYGVEMPEHLASRPEIKRRRISGGLPTVNHGVPLDMTPDHRLPMQPQPMVAHQSRFSVDPLPGTRPTRILIGYWKPSSEPDPKDRHAVYGILGQNDMFRVKVVRETRDGRFVDGNFPSGAGALWIPYEEVEFEPHLKALNRAEVKEYCRVRQFQLDHGETTSERIDNETKAVYEAQTRAGHMPYKQMHNATVPTFSASPQGGGANGYRRHHDARTPRASLPDNNMHGPMERTNALARREIARAEAAQGRADRHAYRTADPAAAVSMAPVEPAYPHHGRLTFHESEDVQRLNNVWARQEMSRAKPTEDVKFYDGHKYERKPHGPLAGKLVSQGTIINIDGEDYVEYRVLTKPSFF